LVINNAHVSDASSAKQLDDLDLVLRLAEPAAMVVQSHRAADFRRCLGNRAGSFRLRFDSGSLLPRIRRRLPAAHDPKLCVQFMTLEHIKNESGFIIECGWEP